MDSQNGQYSHPGPMFGGGDYASTGAIGVDPAPSSPLPASSVDAAYVTPYASSTALGQNVPVGDGDAMINAQYQRPSFTEPGQGQDYSKTGSGQGATHDVHPNSQARP